MSSRASMLRDSTIEIQTGDGDCLILTMEEARTFRTEIETNLLSTYSVAQADLEIKIPIVVNDMTFSLEDAEQLASSLDDLLSHEGRGPRMEINWHRIGY